MTALTDIKRRCEAVEACYEFLLAYAAQGVDDDRQSRNGGQLRELLGAAVAAAAGLAEACQAAFAALGLDADRRSLAFCDLLRQDAAKALAVLELVLAQPRIGSQLIDNCNASLHLRTLLTDIFLLDEVLAGHLPPEAG
ncbi:MAG: hypothetical protein ACP59X_19495 [Solidesulfovibrio sp. DCME]|uniref:hypothetical protein n=1 Tax=Solidesulfovibrio sp. DCME TaxID=3447380 RepID=UPI003D10D1CB